MPNNSLTYKALLNRLKTARINIREIEDSARMVRDYPECMRAYGTIIWLVKFLKAEEELQENLGVEGKENE